MTRLAWREGGQMRFLPDLHGSDRQMCYLEWIEARRRWPNVRVAFNDFLPDWWPYFTRRPC